MKILLGSALILLFFVGSGFANEYISGGVDLSVGGAQVSSYAWVKLYWGNCNYNQCSNTMSGTHYMFDVASGTVIYWNPYSKSFGFPPTFPLSWSGTATGSGNAGRCYRAVLTARGNTGVRNDFTSGMKCIPAPPPPPPPEEPPCDEAGGDLEDGYGGDCTDSPILLDLRGHGFELTDVPVAFDLNTDGVLEQTMWTRPGRGVAFLALDRNGNGTIDSGLELFGNNTLLTTGEKAVYGYIALAEFDLSYNGGDYDGYISPTDAIWSSLRLWLDDNHNGISEPYELQTLDQAGVLKLEYDYKIIWRQDRFGNVFRAKSKALIENRHGNPHERKTYDVFFRRIAD